MDSSRKKKEPIEVHIKRAVNGGYVVRHSYDNFGVGESHMPDATHAFSDHQSMMGHVHSATGGTGSYAGLKGDQAGKAMDKGEATRAGVRAAASTAAAPGPHTRGAGMD